MRPLAFALSCLLPILCGCAPAPQLYAEACATPLVGWRTPKDGIGHLLAVERVEMDKSGAIQWNRVPVGAEALDRYMRMAGELEPLPQIVLTVDPAADCAAVKAIRARMARAEICSTERLCGEGAGWRRWPGGPAI